MTFLFCAFTVYSDLETMGNSAFLSKKINTELDRLEEVTNIPKMDASTEKLFVFHYDIALEHISFEYGSRQIIHDLSLQIPEHTTCAVVGPSGSGKTTLCNLIARFWDVQEGAVRIGGKNVQEYTADSVLGYISMVFQNVYLFHDTVENTIRFGRSEASREEVMEAAKRACCYDFILSLPNGYDTVIGEGGSTLSGGEKQRISIAKAILKDAPIIILDEATSSVDPENEQALLSAIHELTKDKTLISIAHRLSTVENADQIIVIDQGKIVQQGTHHELIQVDGIYKTFWNMTGSSLAMFFFFLSILFLRPHQTVSIGLGGQNLLHFISCLSIFGIGFSFAPTKQHTPFAILSLVAVSERPAHQRLSKDGTERSYDISNGGISY